MTRPDAPDDRSALSDQVAVHRIEDPAEVRRVLAELAPLAEREVCSALPGGPWEVDFLRSSWAQDTAMLGRGVALRELITPQAVNTPASLEYFTELVGRGAQIRVSRRVVQRALLQDRQFAVVPAAIDQHGGAALLVREPAMLLSLYQQFDSIWRTANSVGHGPRDVLQVDGVSEVLRLLADGLTDEPPALLNSVTGVATTIVSAPSPLLIPIVAALLAEAGPQLTFAVLAGTYLITLLLCWSLPAMRTPEHAAPQPGPASATKPAPEQNGSPPARQTTNSKGENR